MFETTLGIRPATSRTALVLIALAALLLSLFSFAQPAAAIHAAFAPVETTGTVNPNNPNQLECLGYDFGYKIDASALIEGTHTYTSTDGLFTVTLNYNSTAKSVSFSGAAPAVSKFVVKGGSFGPTDGRTNTIYAIPVTAGGPSSPPDGAGVSHVTFCGYTPPAITVTKTGDALSKVGDPVNYSITITNTSTTKTAYKVSINDTLAGNLTANAGCGLSLAPTISCTITYILTVPVGASDPWLNTVTAVYSSQAAGAGGRATVSDGHSVNLFQPSITVDKTGPATAEVGDTVTYTVTITNTGSVDSPNLVIDSVIDVPVGNLTAAVILECGALARNVPCVYTYDYTIPDADPDPLVNTVTVHTHPDGFPNDIFDSDDHSVDFLLGEIIVVKDDLTNSGDEFSFVADYDANGFTLSDDGTNVGDEDRNESGLIAAGEYDITELLDGDWELTDLECVSEGDSIFDYASATATVDLANGDTVTCTFTNDVEEEQDNPGDVKIFKTMCLEIGTQDTCKTEGDTSLDGYHIDFRIYAGTGISGTLVDTVTVTLGENELGQGNLGDGSFGKRDSDPLAPGTYTVCEIPVAYLGDVEVPLDAEPRPEAGNGGSTGGQQTLFGENCIVVEVTSGTATVKFLDLREEEAEELGSITIIKNAIPDSAQDFAFTTTGTGLSSFSLDDDANATLSNERNFTGLAAGSYSVTETATTGWTLTSVTCTAGGTVDATDPRKVNITLAAGANVTCVFVNTQDTVIQPLLGSITILKDAVPNDGIDFAFTTTGTGLSGFSLDDDANGALSNQQTFANLVAGSYSVRETPTTGWTLTSVTCSAGGAVDSADPRKVNITLAAGANVTCVFVNTRQGGGTLTGNPIVPVRGGTLTSTGVPNTATLPETADFPAAPLLGLFVLLNAGVFVCAAMYKGRRPI